MKGMPKSSKNTIASRLRRKFVISSIASLLIILLMLLGSINIFNLYQIHSRASHLLQILADSGGYFPDLRPDTQMSADAFDPSPEDAGAPDSNAGLPSADAGSAGPDDRAPAGMRWMNLERSRTLEAPFETRYFWVRFDADRNISQTYMERIVSISDQEARASAVKVLTSGRSSGYLGALQYLICEEDDGWMVLFVDCSSAFSSALSLLLASVAVGVFALGMMLLLVWLMSGKAVAPAVESMEKQKRFISDAGHELKTPLAIISANVDVLEMTDVRNEWTASIRHQVKRMTSLVENMLVLSRMEEDPSARVFTDVDLSHIVQEISASYEAVALSEGKTLDVHIDENLHISGDARSLQQLLTLLMDNAVKYSDDGGKISIALLHDRKSIWLDVANTCGQMPSGDLNRLFDRFYRGDEARSSKKSGYGIGLSVARAIVENHGGTITAASGSDSTIHFKVIW